MTKHFLIIIAVLGLFTVSCRHDFTFQPSTGNLEFSRDTIFMDTVFTNIGSSTYTLKVYNRSNQNIKIPTIRFGKGLDSRFRMTVDGMVGNQNRIFENVELLARDSMFIFIETTVPIAAADPDSFLYEDVIQFFSINQAPQEVTVVTLVRDAIFLFPQRSDEGIYESIPVGDGQIFGFFLDENDPLNGNELLWTANKPYVIYGYAAVPPQKTLQIQPGAKIHFHANSGIIAFPNSSIEALGAPSPSASNPINEIEFRGDRLEPGFQNIPGQWGLIWLSQGSGPHHFKHCTIRNSSVGLYVTGNRGLSSTQPDVLLENVQIYNSSNMGILSFTGDIKGENVVINNAGVAALVCGYGGRYFFNHSTFNNPWPSSRQLTLLVSNFDDRFDPPAQALVQADFHNCIIFGNNAISMNLVKSDAQPFNVKFDHCLIRFNNVNNAFTNNPLYQFTTDTERYINCFISRNAQEFNPRFTDVPNHQLTLTEESAAREKSNPVFSALVPLDLLQRPRPTSPATLSDLGAYQFQSE